MLNENELVHYFDRLNLPELARRYIQRIRASGPSRKVRCGSNNVTAKFPSRKMGCMVPAESHTVELVFIQQIEHDKDVLEYYAQPEAIKLAYASASGRPVGVIHTPDFFLLSREEVGWVECKTEQDLLKLRTIQPYRYTDGGQGKWRCPPGETAAKPFNAYYRVWSSAEADPTLVRNMRFLADYLDPDYPDLPVVLKESILKTVAACPGISAQTLVEKRFGCAYEHLYILIGKGTIYVELKEAPLTSSDRVRLFPDEQAALAQRFAHWSAMNRTAFPAVHSDSSGSPDGVSAAAGDIQPPGLNERAKALLRAARPIDIQIANQRFEIIQGSSPAALANLPARTLRQWKRMYRLAEQSFGCGYIGLLPSVRNRGNRVPRFPMETTKLADRIIEEHYETNKHKTRLATYSVFRLECEKQGLMAPSYEWLVQRIAKRRTVQTTEVRDGCALPQKTETAIVSTGTLAHGDRPWDVVHLDATLCDIELTDERTGLLLGRPWLSVAFDAYSRRVLAFYLTFDRPSYVSCLMVLRECCRRHERLPSCVVVDGGPEFKHLYFESFCACYQIVLKTRPAIRPYFGSVIEKMFGTMETQFFRNLAGNTHILKTAPKITSQNNPQKEAVWTLERLHALFSEYCFDLYDDRIHPAFNMTPAKRYEQGMDIGGFREHRRVAYDENLIAMTLPTTQKGTARIQPGEGVRINYIYYWSDEMRKPGLCGAQVPVRYDPLNLAVAYAYVSERWVKCISQHAEAFEGRSERELKIASSTLLKAIKVGRQQQWPSAKKLAEFFMSAEGEERLRKQQLKTLAARRAVRPKAGSASLISDFEI